VLLSLINAAAGLSLIFSCIFSDIGLPFPSGYYLRQIFLMVFVSSFYLSIFVVVPNAFGERITALIAN